MSGAYIPVDPYDRARLMRLAYIRWRAHVLSTRTRRAGNPTSGAADTRGGAPPNPSEFERTTNRAGGEPPAHQSPEGGSRCDVNVSSL